MPILFNMVYRYKTMPIKMSLLFIEIEKISKICSYGFMNILNIQSNMERTKQAGSKTLLYSKIYYKYIVMKTISQKLSMVVYTYNFNTQVIRRLQILGQPMLPRTSMYWKQNKRHCGAGTKTDIRPTDQENMTQNPRLSPYIYRLLLSNKGPHTYLHLI